MVEAVMCLLHSYNNFEEGKELIRKKKKQKINRRDEVKENYKGIKKAGRRT
jgi:hypothetical protein